MTKPKTTEAQRARFRELTYPAKDDYDKTALQILDDLEAAEAQLSWQPIDTAPTTDIKRPILLMNEKFPTACVVAYWTGGKFHEWRDLNGTGCRNSWATHWRPV